MRRLRLILPILVSAILCARLSAEEAFPPIEPWERELADVSFAPGSPAVILRWSVDRNDDRVYETEHVRVKVLTEAGKKYANVEIPYTASNSAIRNLRARSVQPDGSIRLFDGQTHDKLLVRYRREAVKAMSFALADVGIGTIIEYSYKREWRREAMSFLTRWNLERELPIVREHISLRPWRPLTGLRMMYIANARDGKKPQFVNGRFEFDLNDVPPFNVETLAPPEELIKSSVTFFYTLPGESIVDYWANRSGEYSMRAEAFMAEHSSITDAARNMTAGALTDEEKLQAIYKSVRQLRNLSYERAKPEAEARRERLRTNESVRDVLRNGYGNTRELNETFIALARAAGIACEPVLVSDRGAPFLKDVPGFSQFDHTAASATVKGKTLYFDPGIPYVPFGKLRWDNVFTTALIVPKKGSPIWVRTPDGDPSENKTSRIAVVSLEGDALIGSLHVEFAGQTALKRRLDSHYDDESVKRHSIEEEAKKWFPEGSSVKLTNLTGLTSADSPIVADFELTVANVVSTSGSRALLPARIFETASNHPFSAQRRRHPVFLDFVYEIEDFAEVRLPGDVTVEALPAAVTKNAGAVGYVNEVTKRTSTLSLNRRLRFGSSFVTTDQYPLLRAFMSDVAIADQATISLQKR